MIALLASLALAATPGGFRSGEGVPARVVALRTAAILDAYGAGQATLRGRWADDGLSTAFEAPVILAVGPDASPRLTVGQARLGGAVALDRGTSQVTMSVGIELAFPVSPAGARAFAWAETEGSALPGVDVLMTYDLALFPAVPFVVRVALGPSADVGGVSAVANVVAAQVVPVWGPGSVVAEVEASEVGEGALRGLVRLDLPIERRTLDGVSVDVGAQAYWLGGPAVPGVVAQVRTWFRRDPERAARRSRPLHGP